MSVQSIRTLQVHKADFDEKRVARINSNESRVKLETFVCANVVNNPLFAMEVREGLTESLRICRGMERAIVAARMADYQGCLDQKKSAILEDLWAQLVDLPMIEGRHKQGH